MRQNVAGVRTIAQGLRIGGAALVAYDIYSTYGQISQQLAAGNTAGAELTAAQFIGREGGGLLVGAELGAAGGSVVPGIGTVIGATVGGVAGAIGGEAAVNAIAQLAAGDTDGGLQTMIALEGGLVGSLVGGEFGAAMAAEVLGAIGLAIGGYPGEVAGFALGELAGRLVGGFVASQAGPAEADALTGLLAGLGSLLNSASPASGAMAAIADLFAQGMQDPLVIDLTGTGLNLKTRSLATPYFDFTGNDIAQNTAWIGTGSGFLAIAGADGLVDNGSDLIDSFAQLAALAPGNDGTIDGSNPIFSQLVVWQDLNGDGVCQANEVFTLAQLGIVSISLNAITADTVINGSTVVETATVTMADGTTREIAQVDLNASTTYTKYVGPETISAAAALLPQVQGYGTLIDLRHAMSANPQLLTDVQALLTVDPANPGAFDKAVQTILCDWAGVTGVASVSRGSAFDGQKLGVIEALSGQPYIDAHGNTDPEYTAVQAYPLDQAWNAALAGVEARFLVQDPNSILSTDFTVIQSLDYIVPYTDYLSIINEIAQQVPTGAGQALPFWMNALTVLSESISDVQQLVPLDNAAIAAALQAVAPSFFASSLLAAVANGQMTYVDASGVGSGSPDGSVVYLTSNDLVYVTAPGMTIYQSGSGNQIILTDPADIPTVRGEESWLLVYEYSVGEGAVTINLNAGPSVIDLGAGINASEIVLQDNDSNGSLLIKIGSNGDSILLENEYSNWWGMRTQLSQLLFADGSTFDLTHPTFTWTGAAVHTTLVGSNYGANIFDLGPGGDNVIFGNGSLGGSNSNTVYYSQGDGAAIINFNGGSGTIDLGAGITAGEITLQDNDSNGDLLITIGSSGDSILLEGEYSNWWGMRSQLGDLVFENGTTFDLTHPIFTWTGTPTNTVLAGSDYGANVFDLGTGGDDVLFGNGSLGWSNSNTVNYSEGDGAITINFNGGAGTIDLGAGITASDITLQDNDRTGNLLITIGGGGDSILLQNEYSNWWGMRSQLADLVFADGTTFDLTHPTFKWAATAGDTMLAGSDYGANVFDLSTGGGDVTFGNGSLGWSNSNTVNYSAGDGAVTINFNGGSGTIDLGPGITANEIDLEDNDSNGNLLITIGSDGDSILLENEYSNCWGMRTQLGELVFADGTTFDLTHPTFTWNGTAAATSLTGSDYGANIFDLGAGGGSVTFGNGSLGWSNTNTVNYSAGDGDVTINFNGGSGAINLDAGITAGEITLQANDSSGNLLITIGSNGDSILLEAEYKQNWGLRSQLNDLTFADGSTFDLTHPTLTWTGTASDTALTGSDMGANIFNLGAGGDTVTFGNGSLGWSNSNTVNYSAGDGAVTINTNGGSGIVDFGPGITDQQLWFMQSNDNLVVDVLGTKDQLTLLDWFANGSHPAISDFVTSDGLKLDAGGSQLVSAMASYAANNPGFNPASALAMPSDPAIQLPIASTWHQ